MSVVCQQQQQQEDDEILFSSSTASQEEEEEEEELDNFSLAISLWDKLSEKQQHLVECACEERLHFSFGGRMPDPKDEYPFAWFFQEEEEDEDMWSDKFNAQIEILHMMSIMNKDGYVPEENTLVTKAHHKHFCEGLKEPYRVKEDDARYGAEYRAFANAYLDRHAEIHPNFTEQTLPTLFWKEKRMPEFWGVVLKTDYRAETQITPLKRGRLSPEEARRQALCNEVEVMNMETRVTPECEARWREIINELQVL